MARIIVGSYLVQFPLGGYLSWVGQWLAGFQRLGHDVWFVEKSLGPSSCFDPSTGTASEDCAYGTTMVSDFLSRFGLQAKWCYVDASGRYHGLRRDDIEATFRSADLFVDMGTHGAWSNEAKRAAFRIFIDGEPGYRQMQLVGARAEKVSVPEYDRYYTVGLNIGTAASSAPTAGIQWNPTFNPVMLDMFPPQPSPAGAAFSTIMSWQAHRPLLFDGVTYGQKDVEFAKFFDLPRRVDVPLELAVAGRNMPVKTLESHGWRLRDSHEVTITFDAWADYICQSRGEFSVCKNVFVATNSGFFSDRSAVYLASGRPVVMQDTGFSAHLPCGDGLFAVRSVEEAAAAIDEINGDYARHSKTAREIASEYLDAPRVIRKLLHEVGL